MLHNSKDLEGCALGASDGTLGHVDDLYFDDRMWVVRYLVVATGSWLSNRKVLVAPFAIDRVDWAQKVLSTSITQQQVRASPDIDTEKPVSRQHEAEYLRYYNYPSYWEGGGAWGPAPNPTLAALNGRYEWAGRRSLQKQMEQIERDREAAQRRAPDDPHLRSCNAVMKYHIAASDGEIGHAQGLLVDAETWAIRYLIVNTSNWWLGHDILVAPEWIDDVSWPEREIAVGLTRQTLKDAPPYDSNVPLDPAQEIQMFEYYGRAGSRVDDPR